MNNKPKISVISVVYNNKDGLERTIESVVNQTYDNVEYIIIDGGSSDGTVDIIKKYEKKIDYWISEKDNGIYDAMNKGIQVSTGMWINFMNAGDIFVNMNVLENINFHKYEHVALLYGNKLQNEKIIYPMNIEKLKIGEIMACHQAMFFNKNVLKTKLIYDLNLPIYADYELINKIYMLGFNIMYLDLEIVNFEGNGVSSMISFQKRKDKYITLHKHYGFMSVLRTLFNRILQNE